MSRVRSQAERLLEEATTTLTEAGVASPRVDAELLLAHVTGTPRGMLLGARLQGPQLQVYRDMVAARARRVPLQHLTGSAGFRYVDLEVGPGVFVPRPETELLAGWAVEQASAVLSSGRSAPPVVVDLCTGSGAIALSVVHEVPRAQVHAVELDEQAFAWAERNLGDTGADLRLGDAFEAFADLDGTVDVVVCNPPYIPLDAWESVAPEARDHDPSLALWSGDDGLDAMRRLERTAWRLLRPGGVVGAEHADAQGESAPAVFAGRWADVRDHADLADRPRYVTARRP
ncbi:peptide chain release factor N(5)-glutamine methyltransferase [Aeromicrobium erythreum]|jgi:release factor glutamine methyltransferase|uniref:Release factor glutamine methyltransferase n=1 Tax=Aeromicrobium erythreum TaxID=2041 RepID=A0A0U4B8U0_9ACTN|nr:peptide chain release factor N(5)-glutamine methyltransferase [Aeromicrobium erythreum]ALX04393.1 SAM-dependent methyltransferase [Aeromicrobium erythreum]